MLNTLIAILGDTFSRIMERREYHAIKAKTEMYADFMFWVRHVSFNKFTKKKYIYVIKPVVDDEEKWEGVVSTIKRNIE
jgi:hypothetical protein